MDDLDFYNAVADPANKLTQDAITALMELFQRVELLEGAKNTEQLLQPDSASSQCKLNIVGTTIIPNKEGDK